MKWSTEEDMHFLDLVHQYGANSGAIHQHWHDTKCEVQPGVFEAWREFSLEQIKRKLSNTSRDLSKLNVKHHPLVSPDPNFQVQWQYSCKLAEVITATNAGLVHQMPKRRRLNTDGQHNFQSTQHPFSSYCSPRPEYAYSYLYPPTPQPSHFQQYSPQYSPQRALEFPPSALPFPSSTVSFPPLAPQISSQPQPDPQVQNSSESTQSLAAREAMQKRREEERARRESMGNTTGISLEPHQFPKARAAPKPPSNDEHEWDSPSPRTHSKADLRSQRKMEVEKDEVAVVNRMIDQSLVTVDNLCSFDDVKGAERMKSTLISDLIIATKLGGDIPNVLLYGPPGTGKTMIAYAIAQYLDMKCILITPASLGSAFKGRSEMACKALFQRAEYHSPCLIFFDEAECVFGERTGNDHHYAEKNTLLAYMSSCLASKKAKVCCVAATNLPWKMDRGFLRRFDTKIYVPLPTADDISQLLAHLLSTGPQIAHLQYADDIDTLQIANLLSQKKFSNSDVCNFVKKIPKKALLASPLWELVKNGGDDLAVPPEMNVVISSEFIKSCINGYTDHTPPDETILKEYTLGSWTSK